MSINEEAVNVVENGAVPMERAQAVQIVNNLSVDGLLAPAPQIIRTPADIEDVDKDRLLMRRDGNVFYSAGRRLPNDLPAVVVATGEHVRACREALEGGAT